VQRTWLRDVVSADGYQELHHEANVP